MQQRNVSSDMLFDMLECKAVLTHNSVVGDVHAAKSKEEMRAAQCNFWAR